MLRQLRHMNERNDFSDRKKGPSGPFFRFGRLFL